MDPPFDNVSPPDSAAPTPLYSVLIVEDCRLLAEALGAEIGRRSWAVAVTLSLRAERPAPWDEPDLVLASGRDGTEHIALAKRLNPDALLIAYDVPENDAAIVACAEIGVHGLVPAGDGLDELDRVISQLALGQTALSPRVGAALLRRLGELALARTSAPVADDHLTPREREVLTLIDLGWTNKQIAESLSIEVRTVKNHVHNLLEKLRVSRRGEAAARLRASSVPPLEVLRAAGAGTGPFERRV